MMPIPSPAPHPIRFSREHPAVYKFLEYGTDLIWPPVDETLDAITSFVSRHYSGRVNEPPFLQSSRAAADITRMTLMSLDMLGYIRCGRNIFQLTDSLKEMLLQTDLGDVRISDIAYPFANFYLYLPNLDPEIFCLSGQPNVIDGVYIDTSNEQNIHISVTSRLLIEDPQYPKDTEREFGFNLDVTNPDISIADALEGYFTNAIETRLKSLPDIHDIPDTNDQDATPKSLTSQVIENITKAYASGRKAIELAIAGIIYMNSIDDAPLEYGSDAPQDLVAQTRTGTGNRQRKAASALRRAGYFPVRMVGRSNVPIRGIDADDSRGTTVTPHWRRGHFRRQPHGKGNTERKIVWIKPTIVSRSHVDGMPLPGHIYRVSPK